MGCNQEKKKKKRKELLDFPLRKKSRLNCANTIGIHAIICVCSRGNDCLSQEIVTTIVLFLPIGISDTLLIGH